ncbi:TPA: hypothetical protein ACKP89_001115 [Stenotrophomonas maltophilia]|uniref:hypothetical protein n=1 Tax=Stenotrophomonas maltophilia TaxID=40324 RepID=UPI00118758CB|nr:hypothetical protein [Stenotrophomonas maltophilia]MBA0270638.1 hypothetical protein [Stenotrophomonas maltophilia]MBN5121997.1 hypothetical protein [Stenotrophomonas maltophilia]MBO3004975.1 hypothetical protein [Stenotrophomonas maltophilia]MBP1384341.1 hypothetical protein [Stenotrophomonas maltophilia]MBP1388713.1 hypothetical protein [Stenotrophomonas maltophilia]
MATVDLIHSGQQMDEPAECWPLLLGQENMEILARTVDRLRALNLEKKFYLLGASLLAVWIFEVVRTGNQYSFQAALVLGYTLMALGLMTWLIPVLQGAWRYGYVRRLMLMLHLGVILVAAMIARNIMTSATGLPGQDFVMATGALALPLYIFVWLTLAMLLVGLATVVWQITLGLVALGVPLLAMLIPSVGRRVKNRLEGKKNIALARLLGVVGLFGGLLVSSQQLRDFQPELERVGLWIAYYGDYQAADKYPGLPADDRTLMHANGVYSVARRQPGGVISIEVHYWKMP